MGEQAIFELEQRKSKPTDARPLTPFQQRALTEAAQGVLRDGHAKRLVVVPAHVFASLREAWERIAPRGWHLFCDAWGFAWGRRAIGDLEVEVTHRGHKSLRALPFAESIGVVATAVRRQGLGMLAVDFEGAPKGTFLLRLSRSAIAEACGPSQGCRCALVEGYLRAVFSHLSNKPLAIREAACASQGQPHCTFVAVVERRREVLEQALAIVERELAARAGLGTTH